MKPQSSQGSKARPWAHWGVGTLMLSWCSFTQTSVTSLFSLLLNKLPLYFQPTLSLQWARIPRLKAKNQWGGGGVTSGIKHVKAKVLFKLTNAPAGGRSSLPSPGAAHGTQGNISLKYGNLKAGPQLYSMKTHCLREASLFIASLFFPFKLIFKSNKKT